MAGTSPIRYRYDVFLSHSSADKPVVRELAERLKAAGLRVWFDEWLIQPGDLISAKLEEGLEHSAVLLLCMSANAFGSDWVSLEGHTAIFRDPQNLERRFVPLRLDDAPIKAMLRGYSYIDWRPEADRQAQLGRLLQACGAEAGERPGEPGPATAGAPAAGAAWEPPSPTEAAKPAPAPAQPATAAPSAPPQHPRSLQLLHSGPALSVGWSPDGARLLSGGDDGTLRLWEAASGRELAVLEGHKGPVLSVGWSPDGARLLSGGDDGTLRLWEAASGRELAVLEGHKGWVRSVGWSPDGARLLSGGEDGTLRLWEAASGRELAVLEGHKWRVLSVGWSPDGGLWAAGAFGLVLLWPADLQASPPPASDDEASSIYTNAKVLVVGESGAGKTGLTRRLVTGTFEDSEASTVGAWCTQWSLAQPTAASFGEPQREVWLWDFGGQADQRLIHQLFLDRAALVLLLFSAERDEVVEGLRDWQTALRRSLDEPPPQLLVAARVDAGFGASRTLLQRFAAENGSRLLETSARDGSGCPELIAAIAETIPWDRLPRHTSPRLFQRIKAEILRLRDGGEALLTYKDLRERLRLPFPSLDDATLRTVLGLLDGPGVLKQLDYGDYVLLKPEWLGVYGQAVVRSLKQAEPQLGALAVGAIATADLPIAAVQSRLPPAEEQVLLAELERLLQERKICLRQGGQLVFPSFCGRERPASPDLPPRFMSYAVRGWLDEIHASLVVSLAETRVFELQALWRDAAEFRTLAGHGDEGSRALAVQLQRDNISEGTVTLHTAAALSPTEQVQFARLIQGHLREAAESVQRRRHWLCPHCRVPKGNEAVLMDKLARDGDKAQVTCDACDQRFPLFDDLERLLADPELRRRAEALGSEPPPLTTRRKGKLLLLEVGARLTSANQKWQEINPDEDDGIDMQVEFTNDDGNGTGRYLYLQLKAGPSHLRRHKDGREIFSIKKPRWIHTWTQQPGRVMLVIGREAAADPHSYWVDSLRQGNSEGFTFRQARADATTRFDPDGIQQISIFADRSNSRAFPDVRWMEISSVLRRELAAGRSPEQIRQIEFVGESLDMASVLQWRRKILAAAEAAP